MKSHFLFEFTVELIAPQIEEQPSPDLFHLSLRIYPELKILAPGKAELSRAQRGELMSRIATGDWDLVLIHHSSFTFLPERQATSARFIEHELA